MIEYPSISAEIRRGISIVAFNKLDGNNLRAEWTLKKGLHKFGTKTRLLGPDELPLSKAIVMIPDKYADLHKRLKKERVQRAVCFFEFWGPQSWFGTQQLDDDHQVTLIDIALEKRGILPPREFLKLTRGLDTPAVLYEGNCNSEFVNSVNQGTLEGLGSEGVVCKGPFDRKSGMPIMFKVKRHDWYERLRAHCQGDERLFKQLA
jgi:hypothetical protein